MPLVYVALGGNIGDTARVFDQAIQMIRELPTVSSLRVSSYHRTTPVSPLPQPDFLNAVCCFHTLLPPRELLAHLQSVETRLGKVPKPKNAPRVIDLDIVLYGSVTYRDPDLEIPHPRWKERPFVLDPMAELNLC